MDLPYSLPHIAHLHPPPHPPLLPQGCHLQGTAQSHCQRATPSTPPVESPLVLRWPGAKKVVNIKEQRLSHIEFTTRIFRFLPLIYIFL